LDLLADTAYPITKMMTASLGLSWWSDQMSNNLVSVMASESILVFAKLPDGSYNPQRGDASTLAKVGGLFKHTSTAKVVSNFNASNNLATIVFPYGVTITLAYTSGVLTSVTNGLGRTLTLNYTGTRLTSVTDGTGRSVVYTVDVNKQLTAIQNAFGNSNTFQYDSPGRLWKYFKPQNPASPFVVNTYDSLDRIKSQLDPLSHSSSFYLAGARSEFVDSAGNTSIYLFNRFRELVREIDPLGNATSYTIDGLGRIKRVTQPEGNYEEYTFDSSNNVLTVTKVAKSGSGLANIQLVNTYDPLWNKLKTAKDGLLNTTTYSYDPVTGNLLTVQQPAIGGFTPTVTNTWNARGQLLTTTEQTGIVTKLTYDTVTEKLLTSVVDFGVGRLNLTTSFGYDAVGNVNSVTDPNLNATTFVFDSLRRMTQKTEAAPFSYVTQWHYDANSNLLDVQRQTGGVPAQQKYSWTYSLSDKRLTAVDPANNSTVLVYDVRDRVQSITDAQLRQWLLAYDAKDRISTVTDPTSTVSETRTYTANGKLASLKDARLNITQYTWDGFDRQSKTIFQDTTFEQNSSYDANGNVLTYLTRSGSSIVNTFDVLNRLSTKTPAGQPVVTATYDLAGRLTQLSKPVVASDPSSGALQFFYDTAGRFFKEQYPDLKTVVHVLDSNGNRTKTTFPDGYFYSRSFDQLNRLANIKLNGSATNAVVFSYNQLSQRTQLTYSNGTTVVYTPQLNEDITGITHNFVGSNVAFTYGYNLVHEPTSQAVSDSLYMWHPAAAATVTYAAADNVNKYPTVGGVSYSYNSNKCLTGDGTWTYGYDTENHMLTAAKTGTSASFVYDPLHRQSQKTVGTTKSRYIYSGWQRIADYNGATNALQRRYVYGTGIDEPLIIVTGTTPVFLHHDKMGSIIATSSNAGAVTNKNKFSPFGEITTLAGTTFGFTGQRYDSQLGLHYFKRRYYSAKLGRFLQPDPVGYSANDFNLYTYGKNSPLLYTDPMGEFGIAIIILGALAAVLTDIFGGPPAGECPQTQSGPEGPGVPPQAPLPPPQGPGTGGPGGPGTEGQPPQGPGPNGNNGVPPRPGYQPYQGPGYNPATGSSNGIPPNNAMPGDPNYNPGLEAHTNDLNNTQNNDTGPNGAYPNGYQPGGGYNGGSSGGGL
jgi:RHS repeat-associated protein